MLVFLSSDEKSRLNNVNIFKDVSSFAMTVKMRLPFGMGNLMDPYEDGSQKHTAPTKQIIYHEHSTIPICQWEDSFVTISSFKFAFWY